MRFMRYLLLCLLLAGCGRSYTAVDATSDATLKASIASVKSKLPADQVRIFEKAVATLMARDLNASAIGGMEGSRATVSSTLNGKTAAEIIAMAEEHRAKMNMKPLKEAAQDK